MIASIVKFANEYTGSDEFYDTVKSIVRRFDLNEYDLGYISSLSAKVILGEITDKEFVPQLMELSELKKDVCDKVHFTVKELILTPFKIQLRQFVNQDEIEKILPLEPNPPASKPALSSVLPVAPKQEEKLSKADILSQIENPPRTVLKRYVIEHEPITDPEHLIDDKIDTVPKLQDHYND